MSRRVLVISLLITSLLIAPFSLFADEGMWLPDTLDKLPISKLKSRGLQLRAEEIYSPTSPSLKDAIVQISIGGTGSFVSPEGLILTNHHVAFEAVTKASSTANDYITNGFLAKSRGEEIEAKGYTISVTQDFKDVTAEVLSVVKPEMSAAERAQAIALKQQELAKTAAAGREKEGIRTQVVEMTSGFSYYLYTYLTVRDVRLVYAPPKSIGYFGGDPDNFEWPRHCGDFAFLRAYVGADGKPAGFDKNNVPFKPKKFLPINPSGIKEGDFTMIMGYPGATYRYRESYSIDYRQNFQLPDTIAVLKKRIAMLEAEGAKDPAVKIRNADEIFGLSNTLKAYEGAVKGLKRTNLAERKRAEEAAFTKWLDSNPAAKAKYSNVLPQIGELYRDLASFSHKQSALNQLDQSSDLIQILSYAYGRALDKEKPAAERNQQFSDAFAQRVKAQIAAGWKDRDADNEAEQLADALANAAKVPADQKLSFVENLFAGKSGNDRRRAEAEYAQRTIANSKFKSLDEVAKLFDATAADIKAIDDPALKLAMFTAEELAPLGKRVQAFNAGVTKLRPEFVRGMLEFKKGTAYYPDANFTLRFTYGEVKGYKPRDAVSYDWQTSLGGVLDKDTGEEPFDVPQGLKDLHKKRDFGNYAEARLNDVPVAFLTTTDITGGNSGSPVMNGRGEVIGLAFDGNYEGLAGDYVFEPALNRTLAVDIRYVMFLTEKFGGAGYLFNEMQIVRSAKAMTAKKAE